MCNVYDVHTHCPNIDFKRVKALQEFDHEKRIRALMTPWEGT